MFIYKITNLINNKIYIGQTVRDVRYRWNFHKACGISAIGLAIKKYGIENFTFEVIDTAANVEELNKKEVDFISQYNSVAPFGYNLELGGLNHQVSEVTKEKMRKAKQGKTTSKKQKEVVRKIITDYNKSLSGQNKETNPHIKKASMGRSRGMYITPMGDFYSSYDAAKANNCSQPTVFSRCRKNINNWNFVPKVKEY